MFIVQGIKAFHVAFVNDSELVWLRWVSLSGCLVVCLAGWLAVWPSRGPRQQLLVVAIVYLSCALPAADWLYGYGYRYRYRYTQ